MNKILQLFLLVVIFICGCKNAGKDPLSLRLSRSQAEKDLTIFSDILKKEHPSLNLYISPDHFNSMIEDIRSSVAGGIVLQDFYNKLSMVVNEIGCSHTDIDLPEHIYDSLNKKQYFFPYPVVWIEQKLLVNAVGYDLPEGTEIKEINGQPVNAVMENLMSFNPVEGRHRDMQKELAADRFAIEYFFKYGKQESFELFLKDTSGLDKIKKVKAITWKESRQRYDNNRYYYEWTDVDYDFRIMPDHHCAYLMVHTFSFGGAQKQNAYENFCANSFELLAHRKDVKNLVIDLRENTGGTLYNSFLLYAYLALRPCKEYVTASSRVDHVLYRQYLDESYGDADVDSINKTLRENFTNHINKDYYLMTDSLIHTWEPQKDRFEGNVYVITNSKVMSAASYFGTVVKNSGVGKIIGEETTGGANSGNGYSALYYTLPESGIKLFFPYAHLLYTYADKKNTGMGLKPDYFVPDSYESFKNNSDQQLAFILGSLILN